MQYRIEISTSREGVAKIHLPGRSLELQARGDAAAGWQVAVVDPQQPPQDEAANIVALDAASTNDAVRRGGPAPPPPPWPTPSRPPRATTHPRPPARHTNTQH